MQSSLTACRAYAGVVIDNSDIGTNSLAIVARGMESTRPDLGRKTVRSTGRRNNDKLLNKDAPSAVKRLVEGARKYAPQEKLPRAEDAMPPEASAQKSSINNGGMVAKELASNAGPTTQQTAGDANKTVGAPKGARIPGSTQEAALLIEVKKANAYSKQERQNDKAAMGFMENRRSRSKSPKPKRRR